MASCPTKHGSGRWPSPMIAMLCHKNLLKNGALVSGLAPSASLIPCGTVLTRRSRARP
jgi:hypothetical protein